MKKFTTFILGPLTFVESEMPEMITVTVGESSRMMSKDEFMELSRLTWSVNFVSKPDPENVPQEPTSITMREGEY